ncbi:MAG: hypothetical protein QOH97_2885 [Actinoplanes sp.]|nr:hypothetical protein [Actinoplanes sp.]
MTDEHEELLSGAGLQDRRIVRIGDTVHRPAGPWSTTVQDLLRYLGESGFPLSPEPFGFDGEGREVLSYMPGRDQGWPFLPEICTDLGAERLGRLATRSRLALAGYPCRPDARWQAGPAVPGPQEAVQHGDLGPWNLLWGADGDICAVIDWDMAGVGDPLYDTGHLAWFTAPFMDDVRAHERGFPEPPDRKARLAAFAAGAGLAEDDLIRIVLRTQATFAERVESRAADGTAGTWPALLEMGLPAKARADAEWTHLHLSV